MNEPTGKPILYVDASSLKDSSCERRLIYNNYYGYRNQSSAANYKASYGSAIHRALEYWYGSDRSLAAENQKIAIQKASDYYKPYIKYIPNSDKEFHTPTHLVKTLEKYFQRYNADAEELEPIKGIITPGLLETKFTYPAALLDSRLKSPHFELTIAGTVDMIAGYQGGEIFVDHKSTGKMFGYKDTFFEDLYNSVQMKLYTLMLKRLTARVFPFMINGIFVKKVTQAAEKAKEFDGVNFERFGPRSYTDSQLDEFEGWLILRLLSFKNEAEYQHINGGLDHQAPHTLTRPNFAACVSGFPCPYIKVCSRDKSEQSGILKLMNREAYNPLTFSET